MLACITVVQICNLKPEVHHGCRNREIPSYCYCLFDSRFKNIDNSDGLRHSVW